MATDATHDGYSGVEEGNSIFEGRAFWVALRVPMRKELVNNIKVSVLKCWVKNKKKIYYLQC